MDSEVPAMSPPRDDPYRVRWLAFAAVALVAAVTLVAGPPLIVFALTEVMIFALFATALNLLLSYSGMISFGHAVYFGIAAYGVALTITRLGWPVWAGILAGPLTSALFALVFGVFCVQLTAIHAAMLTLACSEVTYAVVFQWFDLTRGETGISGHVPAMLGLAPAAYGLVVLAIVGASILALWRVVHSPLGLTIRAVGQNPARAAALGHSRRTVQLIAFVISGFFSGVAGTLFSVFHGNVFPDYLGTLISVDGLVMVLLGGLYNFAAGIYGAVLFKILDNLLAHSFKYWQAAIGLILMTVILVSPRGIGGAANWLARRWPGGRR